MWTEAVCAGALEQFAQALAGRAAVAQRAAAEADVAGGEEPSLAEIERACRDCAEAFSRMALRQASRKRIVELLRLERFYEACSRPIADPAALPALIHVHP